MNFFDSLANEFGKNPVVVPAIAFIIVFVVAIAVVFFVRKKQLLALEEKAVGERKRLLKELDLLEMNYLKRRIDQKAFERLFKEKQAELIKIEAKTQKSHFEQSGEEADFLGSIPAKKRHLAVALLGEKHRITQETGIARAKFLKREIDSVAYSQITESLQKQMVEVQSKLSLLSSPADSSAAETDDAKKVMAELKKKLKEIEEEQENKNSDREKQIVSEIIEQLDETRHIR